MKKIIIFFSISWFLTSGLLTQTPQYYNYNTSVGPNSFPFNVQGGKQVQWLVRPGEFNQPSPIPSGKCITTMYFYMAGSANFTFANLTIKLGQTTLTSLPAGVIYSGPLTTVFFRSSVVLSSSLNTWMGITLDSPFPYDTAQSLVIDVSQFGIIGGGGSMTVNQTNLTPIRRCYMSFASTCDFLFSGQDGSVVNCGVDVESTLVCFHHWIPQISGSTNTLYSVKAVNDLVGWVAGVEATIRRTTNGGTTWIDGNPNPGVIHGDINAIEAMNADTAWCTTTTSATYIFRTSNGGTTWTQVFTKNEGYIHSIKFNSPLDGFALGDPVGGKWTFLTTYTNGLTWDSAFTPLVQSGTEEGWNNSMVLIGMNLWFGTSNARVYKSSCFGYACSYGITSGLQNSLSLHFNSNTLGLAGGTNLVRTTDGGSTWTDIGSVPGTGNIYGIEGIGTNFWYIRGTDIYRSSNNGDNWAQSYTTSSNLFDINFANINGCPVGWAVGTNGTIIKIANDSLLGVGNNNKQLPSAFNLEQNYPNPFNPSTKISYALPKPAKVIITVYDMLGRLVKELVNENKDAGFYSVTFDGTNFASGVYFYRIKAGDYIQTRKMLLIK